MPIYTKFDFLEDQVKIKVFFKETGSRKFLLEIKDADTSEHIESKEIDQFPNLDWHHWFTVYYKVKKIDVSLFENGDCVYKETARLTDDHLRLIAHPIFYVSASYLGLGDHLSVIPAIEKLSKSYERKIDVIIKHPELLINNPYVNNIYKLGVDPISHLNNPRVKIYDPYANIDFKFFSVDLRDVASYGCGFGLLTEEKQINFYPDPFIEIKELPKYYMLINPCIRGVDRDLGKEGWQKVVDILNEKGVFVVAEGANNPDGSPNYHQLNIKNGLNLCGDPRMNSLSQIWHLINRSDAYVTFDTGMYILAGTTGAQILLIDSYFDNEFHKPYRKNKEKLVVIKGECEEKCLSKLKYHVKEHGNLRQPLVQKCALNYSTFKCIPSPERIAQFAAWFRGVGNG